jgi:hypothetical protein
MPRTATHLKPYQFHNIPPERQLELARMGGHASPGFATTEQQRKCVLAGVQARQSTRRMNLLVETFKKIEDRHGTRAAVLALWRMGKRSAYDAKYLRGKYGK